MQCSFCNIAENLYHAESGIGICKRCTLLAVLYHKDIQIILKQIHNNFQYQNEERSLEYETQNRA
jgi:hypothetical protein